MFRVTIKKNKIKSVITIQEEEKNKARKSVVQT